MPTPPLAEAVRPPAPAPAPAALPPVRRGAPVVRTAREARRSAGLFALLSLLSLALRLPSFRRPFWSPDEGYLATEAVALRHGGRMYADVVDRKPPLVPWLYEACFAVTGPGTLWLIRLAAVLAVAATGLFTARLAARELGDWAELPAGVLTVAASVALAAPDSMAATFEVFMLPATAAAMYFGSRRRFLAAGVAVAVAALTKQVGLAPLLPLAAAALTARGRPRHTAALAAGVLAPLLGCALLLGPRPFVFWVFLSSGSYASSPLGLPALCAHAAGPLLTLALAFAAFLPHAPALLRGPRPRGRLGDFDRSLWLWLLASAAGVATGFHFYGHYFLQLVPPLALLALRALDAAHRRAPRPGRTPRVRVRVLVRIPVRVRGTRRRAAAFATGCAVAVGALFAGTACGSRPPQESRSLALAAAVDARTAPGDRVFLWGMHPEVYWLAGRPAASRYLTAGLLTNFSGNGDPARVGTRYAVPGSWHNLRRELTAAPPCLIVDDSAGTPYRLADYPLLGGLVAHGGYTEVAVVRGARIYRRAAC